MAQTFLASQTSSGEYFTGRARLREVNSQDNVRPEFIQEAIDFMNEYSDDFAKLARL